MSGHDRGAFETLVFQRCERGFILRTDNNYGGLPGRIWAFDAVETLADWLVEQYAEPMEPEMVVDRREGFHMTGEDRARFNTEGAGQHDWHGPQQRKSLISTLCLTAALLIAAVGVVVVGLN